MSKDSIIDELAAIGRELLTQDNRITDEPIFMVQEKLHYKGWVNVQPFLTEKGAQEYLRINGHNHHGKTRIYADGSFRNAEWRMMRRLCIQAAKLE